VSAQPRTIVVPLTPGQATAEYQLAPGLAQYVQSVYIEVDNTAGADARPVLTFSEQAGVVIGKKEQGRTITAGGTGSASWFLRGTDETAAGGAVAGQLGTYTSFGLTVPTNSTTPFPFTFDLGADLLDTTNPLAPAFRAAGTYIMRAYAEADPQFTAAGKVARLVGFMDAFGSTDQNTTATNIPLNLGPNGPQVSITWPWVANAGEFIIVALDHDRGSDSTWDCYLNVVKIG
jgi:hypothetical protein